MRDRRFRQNAVAEIENKRPAGEGLQHRIDAAIERRAAGEQRQRIEIALHRHAALDLLARKVRSIIQSRPTASTGNSLDIARQRCCRRRAETR